MPVTKRVLHVVGRALLAIALIAASLPAVAQTAQEIGNVPLSVETRLTAIAQ